MLSIRFKTPDGSNNDIFGSTVEELWNNVWEGVSGAKQSINCNIPATTTCATYSGGTGTAVGGGYNLTGANTTLFWVPPPEQNLTVTDIPWKYSQSFWYWVPLQKLPSCLASNPSTPPVDIYRDKDSGDLHYRFAIAGYTEEQVDVSFEDDYLLLTLDKPGEKEEELRSKEYLSRGIKYGKVENKYFVGSKFDPKKIKATLKEGILEVTIPLKEDSKPQKVVINKK